jgi:uncharacterized damage-inducible protein DinB
MESQLTEAWLMNNEVNLFLLKNIPEEHLDDRYSSRTRTVAAQFAHIHNVRLMWAKHAMPDLQGEAVSFEKGAKPTKEELHKALQTSEIVVKKFLEASEEAGKVKNWKGSPATFLGYLIAHEAHHRGLATVALRICGHKLSQEVVYGQWDWGKPRKPR